MDTREGKEVGKKKKNKQQNKTLMLIRLINLSILVLLGPFRTKRS